MFHQTSEEDKGKEFNAKYIERQTRKKSERRLVVRQAELIQETRRYTDGGVLIPSPHYESEGVKEGVKESEGVGPQSVGA